MLYANDIINTSLAMVNEYNKTRWHKLIHSLDDITPTSFTVMLNDIPSGNLREVLTLIKNAAQDIPDITELSKRRIGWIDTQDIKHFISCRKEYKPAKAVVAEIKDRYDIKLPDKIKEKIGSLLRTIDLNLTLNITLGCEGSATEYYHSNSCYWGEYSKSRDYIQASNGGAIRAYKDNKIVGRVWFVPVSNGIVLFNAYGQGELQHIDTWGMLLGQATQQKTRGITAYFNKSNCDGFYLNSERCNFVGFDVPKMDVIDVKLKTPDYFQYSNDICCSCCDEYVNEDSAIYIESISDYVCEYCADNEYTYISEGEYEGYYPNDAVAEVQYYTRNGRLTWAYFNINDGDIVVINGDYFHVSTCVCDEYGTYYEEDSGEYCVTDDGIYPIDECTYNEESGEYEHND